MFDTVLTQLEAFVRDLDPEGLSQDESILLLEQMCRAERICAAGKALTSLRVAGSNAWHGSGHRSPAQLVASIARSSVSHACRVLDTAELMGKLPQTDKAYRCGALSEAQAVELVSAAALAPQFQEELLGVADLYSLAELRRQCARVRANSGSEEQRHARIHNNRELRHWTDIEGAFRIDGRLTPQAGAVVMACLEPFRQQIARRAALEGSKDSAAALDADALVEMAEQARSGSGDLFASAPGASVQVRVDLSALQRGETVHGEVCEVPGVGPIPVAAARAFMGDALLSALVTKGQDVVTVANLGRTVTAAQRTALWERDQSCVVPGCSDHSRLEIHHLQEYHLGGPTALHNLALVCQYHHLQITHHGWRLKRLNGRWLWESAHGPPPGRDALQPELVAAG